MRTRSNKWKRIEGRRRRMKLSLCMCVLVWVLLRESAPMSLLLGDRTEAEQTIDHVTHLMRKAKTLYSFLWILQKINAPYCAKAQNICDIEQKLVKNFRYSHQLSKMLKSFLVFAFLPCPCAAYSVCLHKNLF